MCVLACMSVRVCVFVCARVCKYTHTHIRARAHTYKRAHTHIYTYILYKYKHIEAYNIFYVYIL